MIFVIFVRFEVDPDCPLPEAVHDQLLSTIMKTFGMVAEQAERLLEELVECAQRKDMVSEINFRLSFRFS